MFVNGFSRKAEHFIDLTGLALNSVGQVIIDEKYALIQLHGTDIVAIVPPEKQNHPSFDEVVFYTNFFAYSHEIPTFLNPAKGKALIKPIEKERAKLIDDNYYSSLRTAYESINSLRLGPLGYVYFRWPGLDETTHLPITSKYAIASKEISLYSTAIRQLDPLSEFLGYYRIIESISGNNGKDWLLQNLNRAKYHDFGFLEFEIIGERGIHKRRKNLFSFYKRRALSRLEILYKKFSQGEVAEYFYNENRCGIAHGKTNVKTYDFGFNIREVAQDVFVLKLLARIAIDDIIN